MASSLTAAQRQELKDAFDAFDSDKSGQISEKELGNVFKALNITITNDQLKKAVAIMDTDKSGQIGFNEFCQAMSQTYLSKPSKDELHAAFRHFDQDGSGYIQANELQSVMVKLGKKFTNAQIDALVKSLDASGDGKISFEEFAKLFE